MAGKFKGRAAAMNPPNRFEPFHLEPCEPEPYEVEDVSRQVPTTFFKDSSRSILARNDSPDVPFTYSLNAYRGCEHGCIYCYARPTHEYLGFSAGVDFESKILIKEDAPQLLEATLARKNWQPQVVCISGNTDCYQPAERRLQLTRRCLEVFLRFRNPVSIITKNALIVRDLDLLEKLAALNLVAVTISITTLHADLARIMEPRTSTPGRRLDTVEALAKGGVPVVVNVAPVIPGLNDMEIPLILREASSRGAKYARYILLRLPGAVEALFLEWLHREMPARASKILNRLREVRGGSLSDSRFGSRMRGEGEMAALIRQLFKQSCARFGLQEKMPALSIEHFLRSGSVQRPLF